MGMQLRPVQNQVLVQLLPKGDADKGGIVIPDTARNRPKTGRVVAVGEGKLVEGTDKVKPPPVKPGQTVLFSRYVGTEVKIGNAWHVLVDADEIVATWES